MRPFIHVNCAMSADGKIAGTERKQVRISSPEDIERAKDLRRRYDGILVGVGTVIADDPHLTVKGSSPVRIVLDPNGRTPDDALVLNGNAPTIIVTSVTCEKEWKNASVIRSEGMDLSQILNDLKERGIDSILVEGGGETIASFFRYGSVDKYTVFIGPVIIGGRCSPTPADGDGWIKEDGTKMRMVSFEKLGYGVVLEFEII